MSQSQSLLWTPESVQDEAPAILQFRPRQPSAAPLTLREAFERYKLQQLTNPRARRAKETLGEYWTHIRRWEECPWDRMRPAVALDGTGAKMEYGTTNPVLPRIEAAHLEYFQAWLAEQVDPATGSPAFKSRTINKHLGTVAAILRATGPHGLGQYPHKLPPLPTEKAAPKLVLSLEKADALKRACRVATWPHGAVPAPLWWETLIVGYCTYGFRTQEQARYESDKRSLLWEDVTEERGHPGIAEDAQGTVTSPHGWLSYLPQKQERLKTEKLHLPLTPSYLAHLRALRERVLEATGPVFACPLSNEPFYATWKAIVEHAGIRPSAKVDLVYEINHLRKTASTWIAGHAGKGIADAVTGHADRSVSGLHYMEQSRSIVEALLTLPLPGSFERPLYAGDRQLRLF